MFNHVAPCGHLPPSYRVFDYDKYRNSRLVCVWLTEPDLSRHHPLDEEQRQTSSGSTKTVNWDRLLGAVGFDTICTTVFNRCDSSTALYAVLFGASQSTLSLRSEDLYVRRSGCIFSLVVNSIILRAWFIKSIL